MKIAFVLFDGMTLLDLVGFTDAVTRLKRIKPLFELSWDYCAITEEVRDDRGMVLRASKVHADLCEYGLLFVPGGGPTRQLKNDEHFISWLKSAGDADYKVSVCTGALLLGAAGFLQGKRATTNPTAYELLVPYCNEVIRSRIVKDGRIITAGGVAASVDLGLYVVETLTDIETVEQVQRSIDYPYYKPGNIHGDYALEIINQNKTR
jgi:transcriptional regulator GlxA family with amidase domain